MNINGYNLYSDVYKLSSIKQKDDIAKYEPYKTMDYGLAYQAGYPFIHNGIYQFISKNYQPTTLKPSYINPENDFYDGSINYFMRDFKNRTVNVSGGLYNAQDITMRPLLASVRQY